jgi:hypothetical protein
MSEKGQEVRKRQKVGKKGLKWVILRVFLCPTSTKMGPKTQYSIILHHFFSLSLAKKSVLAPFHQEFLQNPYPFAPLKHLLPLAPPPLL